MSVQLLEARDRIGGRIDTSYQKEGAGVEMGATWLGKKHAALNGLLQNLGLDIFPQQMGGTAIYEALSTSPPQLVTLPPNPAPSYRIKGGSTLLIKKLAKCFKNLFKINSKIICFNWKCFYLYIMIRPVLPWVG